MHDHRHCQNHHAGDCRAGRGRPKHPCRCTERDDDERDLQSFEEDPLERDREADPIHACLRYRRFLVHL